MASYYENTEWVKDLNIPYVIYCASPNKAEGTVSVPNLAREASQYLYHIITNYNKFYDYEIFSQGSYLAHIPDFPEKIKQGEYKKYDLFQFHKTFPYGNHPHDEYAKQFYKEWFGADNLNYYYSSGAFFSVTKKRLEKRSLNYYEELYYKVVSESSTSPWAMERLWQYIL